MCLLQMQTAGRQHCDTGCHNTTHPTRRKEKAPNPVENTSPPTQDFQQAPGGVERAAGLGFV